MRAGTSLPSLCAKALNMVSDVFGEIEESCLLVCHFYLPKEKSDIYMGTLRLTLLPEAVLAPEATTPLEWPMPSLSCRWRVANR